MRGIFIALLLGLCTTQASANTSMPNTGNGWHFDVGKDGVAKTYAWLYNKYDEGMAFMCQHEAPITIYLKTGDVATANPNFINKNFFLAFSFSEAKVISKSKTKEIEKPVFFRAWNSATDDNQEVLYAATEDQVDEWKRLLRMVASAKSELLIVRLITAPLHNTSDIKLLESWSLSKFNLHKSLIKQFRYCFPNHID